MTKFLFKLSKNPIGGLFLAHVPNFWGQKSFPKKSGTYKLIRFSSTIPRFKNLKSKSKKATLQTVGWKDGQTLFHMTLSATARGPTSTTAVDRHLKVKDIEYDVGISKNYCLIVSMQKISSIHKLIFYIQQILVSRTKWSYPFLTMPTQKLSFLNLHQHAKYQFIPSICSWDKFTFRVHWFDWPCPFLTMSTPKFFDQLLIYVSLYQHQAILMICSGDIVD